MAEPTDEHPTYHVEVCGQENDGSRVAIGEEGLLVGRSPTCDVVFTDRSVSRRHAYFHVGQDDCRVEDLGSRNGMLVNGVPAHEAHLRAGDVVDIGVAHFLLRAGLPDPGSRARRSAAPLPATFRHPLAVSAIAFALLSFLHWGFGAGAVVLAGLAWWERRNRREPAAAALMTAGLVMGLVGAGVAAWSGQIAPRLRAEQLSAARQQCRHRLLAIGDAVQSYRRGHAGAEPASLQELVNAGYLTEEQLNCPAARVCDVPDPRYLYLPAGRRTQTGNPDVMALDPDPACHGQHGGWVLSPDGYVEWLPAERFQRLLRRATARSAQKGGKPADGT